MSAPHLLAQAVFDNFAESRDELSFHRGDIVSVIEQNTAGLEGWWLCSFKGRQGIAPGNRLKLLPATYNQDNDDTYDVPPSHQWPRPLFNTEDEEYDIPRSQIQPPIESPSEIYDVPRGNPWSQEDEVYDIPTSSLRQQQLANEDVYNVPNNLTAVPDPTEIYDVPPIVSRGPQTQDDLYDIPLASMINVQGPEETYDIPSNRVTTRPAVQRQESDVIYDIPQSNQPKTRRFIASGLSSLRRMRREVSEASLRKPVMQSISAQEEVDYIYDVPPQVSRDQNAAQDEVVNGLLKRLSINIPEHLNKRTSTASRDSYSSFIDDNVEQYSELQIGSEEAGVQLIDLKQTLENSVSKLLTLVKENWRDRANIAEKVHDIQVSFLDVFVAVNKFIVFSRGATANACGVGSDGEEKTPKHVQNGIRKLLLPLEEDLEMLKRALSELDEDRWDVDKLSLEENSDDTPPDVVDSFVMTSRAVSDDAAQMAIHIHNHTRYIFKSASPAKSTASSKELRPTEELQALQARPLPAVPVEVKPVSNTVMSGEESWLDDYDYVALQDKEIDETGNKTQPENPITGLNKRTTQLISLEREINSQSPFVANIKLTKQDKDTLHKLGINVPDLVQSLSQSIDRLINAVDNGNPPHSFVALSKQVILRAHRLVFISDCIHKHINLPSVQDTLKGQCSDMCTALKHTVASTKLAALQWPSVPAVQEVVDRMFEIAKCAHKIKITMSGILGA